LAPGLTVARRLVTAPPWVLTLAILGLNLLSGPVGLIAGLEPLSRALNWAALTLDLGWIWSVYTVSTAALPERPRAGWIPYAFAAPPIIDAVAMVFGLSMNNSLAALLFFAAFLFCIGQTATAFEEADRGGAPGSLGKTLGTALLLFFSIVGLWWLRQRLLRVAARTAQV
jgi:hypothetical protein